MWPKTFWTCPRLRCPSFWVSGEEKDRERPSSALWPTRSWELVQLSCQLVSWSQEMLESQLSSSVSVTGDLRNFSHVISTTLYSCNIPFTFPTFAAVRTVFVTTVPKSMLLVSFCHTHGLCFTACHLDMAFKLWHVCCGCEVMQQLSEVAAFILSPLPAGRPLTSSRRAPCAVSSSTILTLVLGVWELVLSTQSTIRWSMQPS